MCSDPHAAQLVQRLLQPLSAAQQSPSMLRALSVQLTVDAWRSTKKGWPRTEAAINGCIKAGSSSDYKRSKSAREDMELRLMRAKLLR